MLKWLKFRRTTLICFCLAAFLAGIGLARLDIVVNGGLWFVASALFVAVAWRQKNLVTLTAVIIVGLTAGLWRGGNYMDQLRVYSLLYGRTVMVYGVAENDGVYAENSQLSFDLGELEVSEPLDTNLVGKLSVRGFGENAIYKGDILQVEGKLYQTRGAKQGGISFAQIKKIAVASSPIDDIRRRFQAGMQSVLPEPQASFALGLLIGQRNTLPENVTLQLAAVGLTHIVAVSGYNLTIIVRAVRRTLKKVSKYQSMVVSLALIGLFLLFTGSSPSITRAAIVSLLSLIAWYYGRPVKPMVIILLAAAITAGFYPIYLWSDIGWYLSFLAFFGILIAAPHLTKRIYKNKTPNAAVALAIESFAAQLMTIPLIMYIFNEVSLISLLANILIVPLVPLAMVLSLIAGIAGAFLPNLGGWFAWPARILLTYMLDVVGLLAKIPHALVHQVLKLWQMLFMYAAIAFWTFVLWHKNRGKSVKILE